MMTRRTFVLLCLQVIFLAAAGSAQDLTAGQIIKKADDKTRGLTSRGEMSMTIIRADWTRTVSLKYWSKGSDYSMILITAPARDKGQSFLKVKGEMWNWLPSISRMIKLPPSMMMQSWMGSDFTNDDLVRESSLVKDYEKSLLGTETIRGKACFKIQLDPLPQAPVVWGKILIWITQDGFDQWKAEYYDEDGELVNTMNASDIKKMGDRSIPAILEIVPTGKKGQKTVLTMISMVFNEAIEDSFFSQQNMKKLK
jgi:outer membrane lipoprotein-sorting protein